MNHELVQRAIAEVARSGRLIKDYPYRKLWRIEIDGQAIFLKFYPAGPNRWRRLAGGSPAVREFRRLQWLEKAQVPAPRALAVLIGVEIAGEFGDAVAIEAIEPSQTLLELSQEAHLQGACLPNHRSLVKQVIELLERMAQGGLGSGDLHLGNFLVSEGRVYLIDAYPVHGRGLKRRDLLRLGCSVEQVATRTDLLRGWMSLRPGEPIPVNNRQRGRVYRKQMSRIFSDNRYFGILRDGAWQGVAIKRHKPARRWSKLSRMEFTPAQWQQAWARLLRQIEAGELPVLKSSRSGDVLAGKMQVGEAVISVVIKRPRRKYWYRYLNEIGRGSRARRAWWKSWRLIYRGIPCAWPLLLMEKRRWGYVTDAVIVFEHVDGPSLSRVDLSGMDAASRQTLFHRAGAILRKMEAVHLYHWDAKGDNWIIRLDDPTGPYPMLVDVDGIRNHWGTAEGMQRLLRAMRHHPQYTPEDSLHLCRGYAPFSPIVQPDDASACEQAG